MSEEPSDLPPLVVVALGGNALQDPEGDDSVSSDFVASRATAEVLAQLVARGERRLVVTHGNGPQVGNHLLRSELGFQDGGLPLLPLDVCVADTQGGMGYMLQQTLSNVFTGRGIAAVVTTLVTQVLVDAADPAFEHPSKPVGEMIPEERVDELVGRGWTLVIDPHRRAWRRVVASPDPKEIVEAAAIKALIDDGVVLIAAGGGGIPVVQSPDGDLRGVPAVVDKDFASALLAADLDASELMIVTDVENAYLDYDTPKQRPIDALSPSVAREYLAEGVFGAGSMAPKIEALCRFVEATGRSGVVTSIDRCLHALHGSAGTRVAFD